MAAMLNRRTLLGGVGAIALAAGLRWLMESDHAGAGQAFEVAKDDGEWRRLLTKAQYDVLRLHRTEIPGSSPLNREKGKGVFACAGCDLPLFRQEWSTDADLNRPIQPSRRLRRIRLERERDTIDAVAQPSRLRPVLEAMAKMAATAGTMHFGPRHQQQIVR